MHSEKDHSQLSENINFQTSLVNFTVKEYYENYIKQLFLSKHFGKNYTKFTQIQLH